MRASYRPQQHPLVAENAAARCKNTRTPHTQTQNTAVTVTTAFLFSVEMAEHGSTLPRTAVVAPQYPNPTGRLRHVRVLAVTCCSAEFRAPARVPAIVCPVFSRPSFPAYAFAKGVDRFARLAPTPYDVYAIVSNANPPTEPAMGHANANYACTWGEKVAWWVVCNPGKRCLIN